MVAGPNLEAELVLKAQNGKSFSILPILRSCVVLWRSDSTAFAIVDQRFANHYFLRIAFLRGEQPTLVDLTPMIESHIRHQLADLELDKSYLNAFKWTSHNLLLIGVNAVLFKKAIPHPKYAPAKEYFRGFIVDVDRSAIRRDLSPDIFRKTYGIELEAQTW
jgi:hypothetical protein